MTKADVVRMVKSMGLPVAYDHFAEGESPKPPFLIYLYPRTDNFAADGVTYHKQDVLHIELYTNKKNLSLEENVEAVLDRHGLFYSKSEVWISEERMYEVLYETEV